MARDFSGIANRPSNAVKYDYGHLLIIGGSKHYTGPPLFSALAAYISGVDVVTIVAPKRAADVAASFGPEIIAHPLDGDVICEKHFSIIDSLLKRRVSAIVVGGGMGRDEASFRLVAKLHRVHPTIPFIFDADAIYGLNYVKPRKHDLIIPNAKEFGMLLERVATKHKPRKHEEFGMLFEGVATKHNALILAKKLGCTLFAKGERDFVSDGHKCVEIMGTKYSAVLAKGGTGDMLAGMSASFIAQGMPVYDAAVLAAKVMKEAGNKIGQQYGPFFLPSKVLDYLAGELCARTKKIRE